MHRTRNNPPCDVRGAHGHALRTRASRRPRARAGPPEPGQFPSDARAAALDERLWTFSQESFVAHDRIGGEAATASPVVIGNGDEPDGERGLLVNEDAEVPAFAARFERIAEVINQEQATRQRGRAHYAYYRDQGFELHYHRVE